MGDVKPSMIVAGYDGNFEDIGSSIRVALPSGGHATIGKTPVAKCFSDDQLRAECERRGIMLERNPIAWADMARERDDWKRRAEAAEANNVTAIRAAKIRLLHPRLRDVRPNTLGEVWQQYALGEISAAELEERGCRTLLSFHEEFGPTPHEAQVQRLQGTVARLRSESGPGIAAKSLATDTSLDVDPLDLLADDA